MTKLHSKGSDSANDAVPETLLAAIEAFLGSCSRPAALEYGENAIPLVTGQYVFEIRTGRLAIEVWDETRCISRRIVAIERVATGLVDCTIQKFGGQPGRLTFLDLARPQTARRSLCGVRQNFAEQFRRMLTRQFPGWEVDSLTVAQDLRRSFSGTYPRALLSRHHQQIAAMACPDPQSEADMLTFALLWHHHVRSHSQPEVSTSLAIFLPEGSGNLTAHRLRWLNTARLAPRLYLYNGHGAAGQVDPQDLGNLQTRVTTHYLPPQLDQRLKTMLQQLQELEAVSSVADPNGDVSIRHQGCEFARLQKGRLLLGIHELSSAEPESVLEFAQKLAALSAGAPSNTRGPATASYPERWLEAAVRADIALLDPTLQPSPIHGQVLTFAASDRDLIDLLAVSYGGRLSVIELKAAEDIQLPLQALDYWMHITWHARRDELHHLFPGVAIDSVPPKLLLVAPALDFHSSNATVLSYFAAEVEVERIGVNSDWRTQLKVVLRLHGADSPLSHPASEAE